MDLPHLACVQHEQCGQPENLVNFLESLSFMCKYFAGVLRLDVLFVNAGHLLRVHVCVLQPPMSCNELGIICSSTWRQQLPQAVPGLVAQLRWPIIKPLQSSQKL